MNRAAATAGAAGSQRNARPLREAWQLAAPFWRSERGAWVQLAAIVALSLGTVWINVRFSAWNNAFYDALQGRQLNEFWHQIAVFGLLAATYIVIAVVRLVMQQRLVMHWRTSLTDQLLGLWLQPGAPYRLATATATPDNPDQRIADDVRSFVSGSLELALGLLNASVTLVSFIAILWSLSGSLVVPGLGWAVPGYMVWVALVYSAVGTLLVKYLGAPLIPTNVRQQQVEADFRYALVQVRDHAEAIALARGEAAEGRRLRYRFAAIAANWSDLIRYTKRLTWFSAGYDQLANVFPLLAAAPRFFAGELQLGGLMQTAQAFGQVQGSLSWFITAYASLAEWRATVSRLAAFRAAVAPPVPEVPALGPEPALPAALSVPPRWPTPLVLRAQGLAVMRPHAPETLLDVPELSLRPGEWLLVTGASGSGKSSLLRTLAGLWPAGTGWLHVPESAVFVPQRPYLAQARLAELLAYPHPAERFGRLAMLQVLEQAGLASLAGALDSADDTWARRLSPGEQQRLQFARLFLQRPDWIVLDEATSALDPAAQVELLRRLRQVLPAAAVLSIGHREELIALHDRVLCVQHGVLRPQRSLGEKPLAPVAAA